MINETNLADLLLRHHGANPEDAALAAGLIIDEMQKTQRPLADLVAASKSGFPSFYKTQRTAERESQDSTVSAPESLTQRVASAAKNGGPALDADVLAVMAKIRGRGL